MNSDRAPSTRDPLGFQSAVAEYVEPVLMLRGLMCIESTPTAVQFQSSMIVLDIEHDHVSYEIDVVFFRKSDSSGQYTIEDVLNALEAPDNVSRYFQASDSDRIVLCAKSIGAILEEYGREALAGDAAFYRRMDIVRERRSETLTKKIAQDPIRLAAEKAWKSGDYAQVRSLYESIRKDLTHLERKRLRYAINH